ncbi:cytochrome P450 [Geopyxis carbonaria]|nr:cytochrome P450 [Geopyxis carbonaria]
MFLPLLLAALTLYLTHRLLLALHRRLTLHRLRKLHKALPVSRIPSYFLGLDNFFNLLAAARRQGHVQWIAGRYARHGLNTLALRHPVNPDLTCTIEPANIKTVLATNFTHFALGPQRYKAFAPLLGDGIFTLDGAAWSHSRALLRPQFAREVISDQATLSRHVTSLLALFPPAGEAFDLQPLFFRLTLDSATALLFGEAVGALHPDADRTQASFAKDFHDAQQWLVWRLRFARFHRFEPAAARRAYARVHKFIDRYVDRALAMPPKSTESAESTGPYVFLNELAQATQDPLQLRSQLLNILLAGRDTTASLLGWTFYVLARHPAVYARLRREILASDPLTSFERLKALPYLRHVLAEVLRLYPAVPVNSRTATRDTLLPTGGGPAGTAPVLIPSGARVQWSVFALHRRRDIFGEDAEEFRPERWEERAKSGEKAWGWEYLPFNGGPRICLGQQFALTEAAYTVAAVVGRFGRVEPADIEGEGMGGKEGGKGETGMPKEALEEFMKVGNGERGDEGWAARMMTALVMAPRSVEVRFFDEEK